jgi:hypothetical protein
MSGLNILEVLFYETELIEILFLLRKNRILHWNCPTSFDLLKKIICFDFP